MTDNVPFVELRCRINIYILADSESEGDADGAEDGEGGTEDAEGDAPMCVFNFRRQKKTPTTYFVVRHIFSRHCFKSQYNEVPKFDILQEDFVEEQEKCIHICTQPR